MLAQSKHCSDNVSCQKQRNILILQLKISNAGVLRKRVHIQGVDKSSRKYARFHRQKKTLLLGRKQRSFVVAGPLNFLTFDNIVDRLG